MNTIISRIRALLGRKVCADRAIAGITKAVDELRAVVAHEEALIEAKRIEHERVRVEIVEAVGRANRADAISKKIAALVEV